MKCGSGAWSASKMATNSAVECFEPEIDVARLRVLVALPREVDAPELLAERLDLGAVPVVEKKRAVRILEIVAGEQRLAQDGDRLVLRRDEDVDGAPGERRRRRCATRGRHTAKKKRNVVSVPKHSAMKSAHEKKSADSLKVAVTLQ